MKHTPFKVIVVGHDARGAPVSAEIYDGAGNLIAEYLEPDTAFNIVQACNSHDDLVAALTELAEYAAQEIGLQVADCMAGPIGNARAALKRAKGEA